MMIIETAVATNLIPLTYQRSLSGLRDAIAGVVGAEVKSEVQRIFICTKPTAVLQLVGGHGQEQLND